MIPFAAILTSFDLTDLDDIANVGDLADLLEHVLRARCVEVEAAHRHAAGADTAEREQRHVDLSQGR